ncbi:SRPBCC domain-containing protein [Streptomyces sp. NPDC059578]|uniref:SRPBCC domain-containing protein n=1 Tax=Streptomyces sp. NPDC059578 TaxID=3346874 RepID=UPI003683F3B0
MESRDPAHGPAAYACMMMRRPAAEAFRAFADPAVTSRFWYSKSSGPIVTGADLRWEWETYGGSVDVRVQDVQEGRLIRFGWGIYGQPTTVEVTFTPQTPQVTFVEVTETGFQGSVTDTVGWLNDTVGGFATTLCAMKALLEHGIELNAVPDHHPHPA